MDNNVVYIKVNKALCRQLPSKHENRQNFNIMKLPKGTVIEDTDLSYAIINPIIMIEDRKNPNMYCAIYEKNRLKNNSINVYMNVEGEKKYMPVDVDVLRGAVAAANHAYYEQHKEKVEQEAEKKTEKDNLHPLTVDKLREQEEEQEV